MRILYLSDVFFPRVNGVSTSIATFVTELRALGHQVDLVAPSYGDDEPRPGVTRLPARTVPFDPEDRLMSGRSLLRRTDALARRNYDLVHIQTPFVAHRAGVPLARRLGVPVVETVHTFFEEYLHHYIPLVPRRFTRALTERVSRRQCDRLDAVVVPSRAMAEALASYGVETPVRIVPTGLRPAELSGGNGVAFRQRYRIPEGRPTLVHIGRLAHEKNIDFLLRVHERVVREVPDALLVIAGEGPASRSLRRQVAAAGLEGNVLFVGYLDRSTDLLDCYRAADAFLFASRTETQGLVLLEALALSIPVVSTAIMGTRDILEPRLGALVAEDDEEHFTQQVLRLLRQPDLRNRLRREGREYALGQWNAAVMARRMETLYRDVVAGRSPTVGPLGLERRSQAA